MTAPDPRAEEQEARRLLTEAGQLREWAPERRLALKRAIAAKLEQPSRNAQAWLLAPAAALALVLTLLIRAQLPTSPMPPVAARGPSSVPPAPSRAPALAERSGRPRRIAPVRQGRGVLELGEDAVFRSLDAGPVALELSSGELLADLSELPQPILLSTPFGRVESLGARLRASVFGSLLTVRVELGQARVEVGGHAITLSAGEALRSDDPRFTPTASQAGGTARPPCAELPELGARIGCTAALAKADDLAAQNALYALGRLYQAERHDGARAIATWRSYQERFPGGVLAIEVSQGILAELIAGAHYAEAEREADRFLARFGDDGRAAEVALIRANLLREQLGDPARALLAYRVALAAAQKLELRDEASFGVVLCTRALGPTTDAKAAFDRYLNEFPNGAHRDEATRLSP